eukprot:982778-Pelagomonas_calceolata.AAC.11
MQAFPLKPLQRGRSMPKPIRAFPLKPLQWGRRMKVATGKSKKYLDNKVPKRHPATSHDLVLDASHFGLVADGDAEKI